MIRFFIFGLFIGGKARIAFFRYASTRDPIPESEHERL